MRPSRPFLPALLLGVVIPVIAADSVVEQVDALAAQWTTLQRQQDLLESNWRLDKPVLEQQLDLLQRESDALDAVLSESTKQQDEVEQRRLELVQQQTTLEQEQNDLVASLGRITAALHKLHPQLPPPLVEGWNEELPKLDDAARENSDKLQIALGLMTELADFQQKITLNETVMMLADGQQHLVTQIYLGTGQGWYVSSDLQYAAIGTASVDGWRWTETNEAAAIARIVEILERQQNPELVTVPAILSAMGAAQ